MKTRKKSTLGEGTISLSPERRYTKGDRVLIRAKRSAGGCVVVGADHPEWSIFPTVGAVIDQIDVFHIPGCYSLTWEDGEPIGLGFYQTDFVTEQEDQ